MYDQAGLILRSHINLTRYLEGIPSFFSISVRRTFWILIIVLGQSTETVQFILLYFEHRSYLLLFGPWPFSRVRHIQTMEANLPEPSFQQRQSDKRNSGVQIYREKTRELTKV